MNQQEKQERAEIERDYASLSKGAKHLALRDAQGRRSGIPTRNKRKRAEQRMRAKGFKVV